MQKKKINNTINYFSLSKYNYISLFNFPSIINLNFNVLIYYKQKHKYILFINIIFILLFFNPNLKTRYIFKQTPINILQTTLRTQNSIIIFLNNFIYIYFPLIDSFSIENKFFIKNSNIIVFSFFKFPLLFELNTLFNSLDHLYIFLNNYKFQFELKLKKQKNNFINLNLIQFLKLPLLIK